MKSTPWFKFFPQDFLVGTAFMSCSEVGAYIRMLCYQWTHGGLPNDQPSVARLVGCDGNAVASVWHKFGECEDGKIRNTKMESVREQQTQKAHSQAVNATKRWRKANNQSNGNAMASTPHVNGSSQKDACQISDIRVSPIVPNGDKGGVNNPIAKRINTFMGRRESTAWSEKEIKAFKKVKFHEDDIEVVEAYYASERRKPDNICRTSVQTLLNNWPGEVDRARSWVEKKSANRTVNGERKPRLV